MKKKFLITLITVCTMLFVFAMINVSAASSGSCGANLTWTLDDGGTLTISGSGKMDRYSYHNPAPWDSYRSNIKKIVLGNNVTDIGIYAFYECDQLTNVTIPDNITTIGSYAFSECTNLRSITIGNGVKTIGTAAFSDCSNLTSLTIGNSVTTIGENAFDSCISLTNVVIPDSVISIEKSAFRACSGLSRISIGVNVASIGNYAFSECTNLTNITIPDSVATIGIQAFQLCNKLINIIIGKSVASIGEKSFVGCSNLTTISVDSNNKYFTSIDGVLFNNSKTKLICYPCGKTNNAYIVPNTVKGIENYAFYFCDNLTSITISENVTTIGESAFRSCDSLTSVTIGNNVNTIGNFAFYMCNKLTNLIIGNRVSTIGNYAFYDCDGITSVSIGDSVTNIGDSAFGDCDGITSVSIGDGVTNIGDSAFGFCDALTSVTMGKRVTNIGKQSFIGCNNLRSVTLGNSVIMIGEDAFNYCYKMGSINIPGSVKTIGKGAFDRCYWLANVYYNGNSNDWNNIFIGENNTYLNNAKKHYFAYITLLDESGNVISSTTKNMNEYIDTSLIAIPEGYNLVLYKNKDFTEVYDVNNPITENLTLYVGFMKFNLLEFAGPTTANKGEKGITQSASFATDKTAKYFSCTLKVPNSLEVQEIKSDIFEIEQDSEVIGNNTYYYLFLIHNDGNIPTYKTINAFEMMFDVSENAIANEILSVEIMDDAILADDSGNSYEFTSIGKAEIKINPILAEEITIVGADEIDAPTQYAVSVLPENTTNPDVEWSVSDETIATISKDGLLTPVKKGIVTIKATTKDGSGVYAEKTVSVKVLGTMNSIVTNIGIWDKEYLPDTTNYTIYVPKTTTSIRLTAKHDGTLRGDGLALPNNVTRTLTLSKDSDETVLDLSYTCEGYDDNKYTITIIKFEGTKTEVSEDKKSFTITPINIENGKTVILALYDGEKFVEMQSAVYNGEAIPFTTTKTYTNAKVMVWDDITNLKPICETENVQ